MNALLLIVGLAGAESVGVAELRQALSYEPRPLVVDLRDEVSFASAHIGGALAVGGRALRHRRALMGRELVLVDTVSATCATFELRRSLLELGFPAVRVLAGGIDAWRAEGAPLDEAGAGAAHAPERARAAQAFTPLQLQASLACAELDPLVVAVDGASIEQPARTVALPLARAGFAQSVLAAWRARLAGREPWRVPVVLVDADGAAAAPALRALEQLPANERKGLVALRLAEGAAGWRRLVEARASLPDRCPTCGGSR